jgi:hypothetical protein
MGIKRSFDIQRLKPFHREGNRMPKPAPEKADEVFELDHDLRPDEQAYVNHYIGYADVLLNDPNQEEAAQLKSLHTNVIELPRMQDAEQAEETEGAGSNGNDNGKAA